MKAEVDADSPEVVFVARRAGTPEARRTVVGIDIGLGARHRRGARVAAGPAPLRETLAAMSDADAHNARENLLSLARQVAKASGGLFGLFPSVGDAERSALQKIAAQLEARPAASGLAQNI